MRKWIIPLILAIYLASCENVMTVQTVDGVNIPIAYARPVKKVKKTAIKTTIDNPSDHTQAKPQNSSIKWGKYSFNIVPIADWKRKIYKELKIPPETSAKLHTLNLMECGEESGFCLSNNNGRYIDAGPFQINKIHKEEFAYAKKLVLKGLEQKEVAIKTGNWSEVIKTRDELFKFSLKWTYDRAKEKEKTICHKWKTQEQKMKCQAVLHNGSSKKMAYGAKAVAFYNKFLQLYR